MRISDWSSDVCSSDLYVDSTDWKRVVPCAPAKPATASCRPITTHRETIDVAGTDAVALTVEDAAWGPILEHESDGSALALRWTAHLPGALNLGLSEFARAEIGRAHV